MSVSAVGQHDVEWIVRIVVAHMNSQPVGIVGCTRFIRIIVAHVSTWQISKQDHERIVVIVVAYMFTRPADTTG